MENKIIKEVLIKGDKFNSLDISKDKYYNILNKIKKDFNKDINKKVHKYNALQKDIITFYEKDIINTIYDIYFIKTININEYNTYIVHEYEKQIIDPLKFPNLDIYDSEYNVSIKKFIIDNYIIELSIIDSNIYTCSIFINNNNNLENELKRILNIIDIR